jgi:biotin carboxyl carrier protein
MTEVKAPLTGNLWKVLVTPGQAVSEGDVLVIMESMKMEINVAAPCDGKVRNVLVKEGATLKESTLILVLD